MQDSYLVELDEEAVSTGFDLPAPERLIHRAFPFKGFIFYSRRVWGGEVDLQEEVEEEGEGP